MPTCEYCGGDFAKGGAYATHLRYCADRPEPEKRAEGAESADAGSTEGRAGDSAEEGVTEHSDTTPESRTPPPERESDVGSVTAEIRDSSDENLDADEPSFTSEPTSVPDQVPRKWLVAGVLVFFVVVVWMLLRSGEDE